MMMGADYYQTEYEVASLLAEGKVPIGVGHNTKIRWDLDWKTLSVTQHHLFFVHSKMFELIISII